MSLLGALQVGKSALAVSQAAIQVTGNNIANAGNADYTRQTATIVPSRDQQIRPGMFVGTGVDLTGIRRQVDEALNARLRGAVADNKSADTTQQWFSRVEAVFNELGDEDLSTQLSQFFNAWSNLANKPQDTGLRQIVLQSGQNVASWFNNIRGQLSNLQSDVDARLAAVTADADALAGQIADLNQQIVNAEGGSGQGANGLRDRRDALLKQLSELMNISTVEDKGVINVYVGSEPLVMGASSLGVALKRTTDETGAPLTEVVFKHNNGRMNISAGQIGALVSVREQIGGTIDKTDDLAANLIFELNKIHAAGQGLSGFTSITGAYSATNPALALNDPDAGLDFTPKNGSFVVHVRQKASGIVTSTLVKVDLDGAGGNDTTLTSLASSLDGVNGVNATVNAGKLTLWAESNDVELSFSQDSSGALAALGVNNFFKGYDARTIRVNTSLTDNPLLLAAARNGQPGDNQTAVAIAALESMKLPSLQNASLKDTYQSMVNTVATSASAARTNAEASLTVLDTLTSQREALSGVSLDEEAINLIRQQRAFQAASRIIAAVDEMMRTLMNMA